MWKNKFSLKKKKNTKTRRRTKKLKKKVLFVLLCMNVFISVVDIKFLIQHGIIHDNNYVVSTG